LGVPLLGRIPLDPGLALRCDQGQIEIYPMDIVAPIAAAVSERVPAEKCKPIL